MGKIDSKTRSRARRLGIKPTELVAINERGLEPELVISFARTRGVSIREALATGRLWTVEHRPVVRVVVFGQTAFDAYRQASTRLEGRPSFGELKLTTVSSPTTSALDETKAKIEETARATDPKIEVKK